MKRDYITHIKEFERFNKTNRKEKSVRSLTAKARVNIFKIESEIIIIKSTFREYV